MTSLLDLLGWIILAVGIVLWVAMFRSGSSNLDIEQSPEETDADGSE